MSLEISLMLQNKTRWVTCEHHTSQLLFEAFIELQHKIKISTDHKVNFLKGTAASCNSRSYGYVCSAEKAYGLKILILFMWWEYFAIQSKHKSLGILLFFHSCFLLLFVWLSECSCGQTGLFFPNDLKCANAAKVWGCRNLEKIIYMEMGNL